MTQTHHSGGFPQSHCLNSWPQACGTRWPCGLAPATQKREGRRARLTVSLPETKVTPGCSVRHGRGGGITGHTAQMPPWAPLPRGPVRGSTGTVRSPFAQEGHGRGHQAGSPGQHLDQVSEQPSRQKCPQRTWATLAQPSEPRAASEEGPGPQMAVGTQITAQPPRGPHSDFTGRTGTQERSCLMCVLPDGRVVLRGPLGRGNITQKHNPKHVCTN